MTNTRTIIVGKKCVRVGPGGEGARGGAHGFAFVGAVGTGLAVFF